MNADIDTQEKIRTGRNLNKTLRRLKAASPEVPVAFELANHCTVASCRKPLLWIRGSSVCSCENGHIHDYKSGDLVMGM